MKRVNGVINPEDNNSNNQDDLQLKSTGRLFMDFVSKISVGIYSYLQGHGDKDIEVYIISLLKKLTGSSISGLSTIMTIFFTPKFSTSCIFS